MRECLGVCMGGSRGGEEVRTCRWRADNGPTLNAGLKGLRFSLSLAICES